MKKKYGLIGFPLGHSFSKDFFNKKFSSEGIDAEYVNFEIKNVNELKYVLRENPDLCGLNVTLPHKMDIIPLLDNITDNARIIGAVNVIKFKKVKSGKLLLEGHNSDITGFKQSIESMLNETHRNALILGTGGASKAIFHGLKQLGLDCLFASRVKENNSCITYDEITPDIINNHTVIVNATPLGMFPNTNTSPDIPYENLTTNHILYDLIYNPDETLFMKKGKKYGAEVKNGLEMLLLQAFISWEIWNSS